MRYIRTNSLKRLFSVERRSFDGDIPTTQEDDNNKGFSTYDPVGVPFQGPSWKCFSRDEIFQVTDGFSSDNLVGKGGYAEVYKGKLGGSDGEEIVVRSLTRASTDERKVKEFLTEIGTVGHVRHPNVLYLLGYCIDNRLYIIFQFSSRGSLSSLLHGEDAPMIDWMTRYQIVLGTARGLHYLHKGCQRRIIHRDIKSSNILLTSDFEAPDSGLAKWLPPQWSHHSIGPIEGTFGHLTPEYFMHGIVDEKTDVLAIGVFNYFWEETC